VRRRRWPGPRTGRGALHGECSAGRPGSLAGGRAWRATDRRNCMRSTRCHRASLGCRSSRPAGPLPQWGRGRRARRWTYFASNWANMLWNAQMLLARASGDAAAAAGVRDFLERWRQGRVVRAHARRASDPARPWLPWQQRAATELARTIVAGDAMSAARCRRPRAHGSGRRPGGAGRAGALAGTVGGLNTALLYTALHVYQPLRWQERADALVGAAHARRAARRCATRGAGLRTRTTGARCAMQPTARCWRLCMRSMTRPPRPRSSAGRCRSCGARRRGVASRQSELPAAP